MRGSAPAMAAAAAELLLDELELKVVEKEAAFAAACEARLELRRLRRLARRSAKRCCDASTVARGGAELPCAEQVLRDLRRAAQQARDAAAQEKRMLRLLAAAAKLRAAVLRLKARLRRAHGRMGLAF